MEKKGTDRGVVVDNPLPYAPGNIHLSKAEFVAKERARREKELKIKEFVKTLDEPKAETPVEEPKKKTGRPKKIV